MIGLKKTPEEIAEIMKLLDDEEKGLIDLGKLLEYLKDYLNQIGTKREMLESFRLFDQSGSGKISLFDFRF